MFSILTLFDSTNGLIHQPMNMLVPGSSEDSSQTIGIRFHVPVTVMLTSGSINTNGQQQTKRGIIWKKDANTASFTEYGRRVIANILYMRFNKRFRYTSTYLHRWFCSISGIFNGTMW